MRDIMYRAFFQDEMCEVLSIGLRSKDDLLTIRCTDRNSVYMDGHRNMTERVISRKKVKLMQYTGKKDKFGVNIFEDDICTLTLYQANGSKILVCPPFNILIEWNNELGKFGWVANRESEHEEDKWFAEFGTYADYEIEVVGNIHESPGLLECKKCQMPSVEEVFDKWMDEKEYPSDMILVAVVNVTNNDMSSLFRPLGSALAPLDFYVTPCIQDANYLNKERHKGRMTWIDFVRLVRARIKDNIKMDVDKENGIISVYTDRETYEKSVYSSAGYIKSIYKKDELPIEF